MKTDVTFTYKNYRGETSIRLVRPIMVAFGTTGFHPEPQWLLHGWDLNKDAERTFAMRDIKDWEAASPPEQPAAVPLREDHSALAVRLGHMSKWFTDQSYEATTLKEAQAALAQPQYLDNCKLGGECHGQCESTACTNYGKAIVVRRCVEDVPTGVVMPKETK